VALFYKAGVDERTGKREIWFALGVAYALMRDLGKDLTITSLDDGLHGEHSKHYEEEAVDIRTKHLLPSEKAIFASKLNELLNPLGFDCVFEKPGQTGEHEHVEFDPKAGEKFLRPGA
jgi:hypothetical protein